MNRVSAEPFGVDWRNVPRLERIAVVCKSQSLNSVVPAIEPSKYFRLMLCGYPTALLHRKVVAVVDFGRLIAYADESEQPDSPRSPYLIAAYILPADVWMLFADEWHKCCINRQPCIDYFHAVEAEALEGQFQSVAREFRNAKIRDLVQIIMKFKVMNLQCWVDRNDYNSIYKGNVHPEIDDPYFLLFFQLISLMAMAGIHFNVMEPVDFIFDTKKHMEQRVLNAYFEVKKRASPFMLRLLGNTPRFEADTKVPPLQAADMLAWHIRRSIACPDEQRPIPGILDMLQSQKIAETLHLDREILESIVEQWNDPAGPFGGYSQGK